jgi:hypothetical protein
MTRLFEHHVKVEFSGSHARWMTDNCFRAYYQAVPLNALNNMLVYAFRDEPDAAAFILKFGGKYLGPYYQPVFEIVSF